jgi:hypothetical protein
MKTNLRNANRAAKWMVEKIRIANLMDNDLIVIYSEPFLKLLVVKTNIKYPIMMQPYRQPRVCHRRKI